MKEQIQKKAYELGFDDIRFACANGRTFFVAFTAYGVPVSLPPRGQISISNYYVASQRGYVAMKKLLDYCAELGVSATEIRTHDVKQLAAKTGGYIGKNTLFYHDTFGSLVCIHMAEVGLDIAEELYTPQDACGGCTACQAVCPTGAITREGFGVQQCIRAHLTGGMINERYGVHIYQIMGCERCQTACPKNKIRTAEAHCFDIVALLEGKHIKEIRALIGANYGRRRILLNQTLFYAANIGYTEALLAVRALVGDPFCGAAARYAQDKLESD